MDLTFYMYFIMTLSSPVNTPKDTSSINYYLCIYLFICNVQYNNVDILMPCTTSVYFA